MSEPKADAWEEINSQLAEGEEIEAVVFGTFGYAWDEMAGHVPAEMQGIVLTAFQAEPFMHGWSFVGGFGSPECHAAYIWTTERVFWVVDYDGSTRLDSAPRHPRDGMPEFSG